VLGWETGDAELPKFGETWNGNPEPSLEGMLDPVAAFSGPTGKV
jgi:hypothetical protein